MRKLYLALSAVSLLANPVISQVTSNSNRFEVKNYIAIDDNGRYNPYYAHGFAENVGSGSNPSLFIMPLLELKLENIKYIDLNGNETNKSNNDVYSISIPIIANLSLPNQSQKAAIGAALNTGTTIKYFSPPIVKNNFGVIPINPNAGVWTGQIIAQATQYEQRYIIPQQQLINSYNIYKAQIISLSEYEVIVKVGNDVVYDERFSGTLISMGNTLDDIAIDKPTEYVKNRIANGNFSIVIKYKFRDSKGSYINAQIDAQRIVNQFLSDDQKSSVSQSSSGWSFLGFGSSRKSIKSSFDQQVNEQFTDQRIANTTIEMFDADDQMIQLFENAFFPIVTQQNAIENHIASAERAKLEGNTQLMQYHLDYAKALQTNNPNLEADIGKAVASLAQKDYVGFIANGVRWGDYKASGNSSFRRTLNSTEMTQMQTKWSQTKKISVQHAVTQKVALSQTVDYRASIGLIDGIAYPSTNMYITNGYTTVVKSIKGVILGPITEGGALHQNNISPGSLITKIGSQSVFDGQSLTNAINNYKPGQTASITLIEQVGFNLFQEKLVQVTFGAYPRQN
jgi:hypothetical protein